MSKRNKHRQRVGTTPQPKASKDSAQSAGTFWGPGTSSGFLGGAGLVGRNTNLSRTVWGAATAYQIIPEVNRAQGIRADALGSLPWEIVQKKSDGTETILATHEDNVPRHPLQRAFQSVYRYSNRSLLSLMCYSKDLSGEIYIQKTYTEQEGRGLFWLNPLGCTPNISAGAIQNFQYTAQYGGGSETLYPREVAYYHDWNPYDDFRGQGLTQVVMQKINISRNLDDFIEDFFGNNARPGAIISPAGDEPFSLEQATQLQSQFDNYIKGRGNAWSTYVNRLSGVKFDTLDQPKVGEHYTIAGELSQYIYTIYGVPKAIAGDEAGTQYKTGDDIKVAFFQITILPLASHIERFINYAIMPYFDDSGAIFRFNTTEFDLVSADDDLRSQIATRNYDSGLWTRNKALEYVKQKEIPAMDFIKVDGVPIPLTVVPNYWEQKLLIRPTPVTADVSVNGEDVHTEVTSGAGSAGGQQVSSGDKPAALPPNTIEGKATQTTAEDELRAWERKAFVHGKWKAEFSTAHLSAGLTAWMRHSIDHTEGDRDALKAVFATARDVLAESSQWSDDKLNLLASATRSIKSYEDTANAFESELLQTFHAGAADEISRAKFSGSVRRALRIYGLQAFRDGMEDEGYSPESFNTEELATFRNWQDEQSGYVSNLGKEIYSVGLPESDVEARVKMWVSKSLNAIYYEGKILAAPTKQYTWHLGYTEKHCKTCLENNGQTKSLKNWKLSGLPQSESLDCHGYNCDCAIYAAE